MVGEPRRSSFCQHEQPYFPDNWTLSGHRTENPSFYRPTERHREKRSAAGYRH